MRAAEIRNWAARRDSSDQRLDWRWARQCQVWDQNFGHGQRRVQKSIKNQALGTRPIQKRKWLAYQDAIAEDQRARVQSESRPKKIVKASEREWRIAKATHWGKDAKCCYWRWVVAQRGAPWGFERGSWVIAEIKSKGSKQHGGRNYNFQAPLAWV